MPDQHGNHAGKRPISSGAVHALIELENVQDPVFAADGHTYERCEIERWLQTKSTSPLTNEVLAHKMLTPNHNLRSQIRDYYSPVTTGTPGASS
jgi:hypothetical protein